MNHGLQKMILKKFRTICQNHTQLDSEFSGELIETINTLIGRINCYSTDDDSELKRLAIEDELARE